MFLGVFLFDLAESKPNRSARPDMRIDEFYIERKLGSKINGLLEINKTGNPFVDRIVLDGLAIMDEDKMIGELNEDEGFLYYIMRNELQTGYITVKNPDEPDKLISLEILKSNTDTDVKYDGGATIEVIKEVNMETTIAEAQQTFTVGYLKEKYKLEKNAKEKIKRECMKLYEKYKEEDIDIFDLQRDIDIKYPNANIDKDNIFDHINLTIKVNVFNEGSTDVVNFY